jgi:predicted phosphate transport protein (TIGR00153 family)
MRFRLIPRDQSFYPLFDSHAITAAAAARQLGTLLTSLPPDPDTLEAIITAERAGDQVVRAVRDQLETSIVTPFDREDIQELIGALDDVLDEIRAAADLVSLHQVSAPLGGVAELVQYLQRITDVNVRLVGRLKELRDLGDDIDEIDRIEHEADAAFRRTMAELFGGSHDAVDILKWKDVVEAIERAINAVEDASDVISSIAVKHA